MGRMEPVEAVTRRGKIDTDPQSYVARDAVGDDDPDTVALSESLVPGTDSAAIWYSVFLKTLKT